MEMNTSTNIISFSQMDNDAINNFRQYLRIPTVHPNINYDECIKFLENQATSLDLPFKVYRCAPDKPILIITWVGTQPNLPSIWLNSHMDVVPVYEEKWTYKPFDAHMDEKGNIYARGAQDMKCVGIQYLEAVRRLKTQKLTFRRTIHIAFVPDEELQSVFGMRDFIKTQDFKNLNVGFALDEGVPSQNNNFDLLYGEKIDWKLRVHCPGQQGHGSILLPHPPGDKIAIVIQKFNEFRTQQLTEYMKNPTPANLEEFTSINLTILEGGIQPNVVPPEFVATFDIRFPDTVDLENFEKEVNKWCKAAGEDVWIEFTNKGIRAPNTKLDESNPFWIAFKKAMDKMEMMIVPSISAGFSDARFFRQLGIPALGFSPIYNTIPREHDNDEYLNAEVFLKGIQIYMKIIEAISNVQ